MKNNIQGNYKREANNTFKVGNDVWQIKQGGKRNYLINKTKDTYISGLFPLKGDDNEGIYSFDYDGNYYFMQWDTTSVDIYFVDEKKTLKTK